MTDSRQEDSYYNQVFLPESLAVVGHSVGIETIQSGLQQSVWIRIEAALG